MKTLLAVFAHPDDESFGPGGTLAKYAREGVSVHYLCATRGEAGIVESRFLQPYASIAQLRTMELERAAQELGLATVHFLGYRDSGMPGAADNGHQDSLFAAPPDQVAQRIAHYMALLRPDAIITHDQYGWYGHPDHVKCHQATLRAFELLYGITIRGTDQPTGRRRTVNGGRPRAPRLYLSTYPKRLVKVATRVLPLLGRDPRRFGQNRDIDLVQIAWWEVPVTTRIHVAPYLGIRERASACHASQRPLTATANPIFRALLGRQQTFETFRRVYPEFKGGERLERDLFSAPVARAPRLKAPSAVWGLVGMKRSA